MFPWLALATTVTTTHATVKIRPTDPPPPAGSAPFAVAAARNEFEAFQIVVAGATGVRATASLPGLPAGNVWLYREATLELATPSNAGGATGAWPDALIPDRDEIYVETRNAFPFDAPRSGVIWVEVLVPEDQAPGIYHGNVRVT